MYLQPVNPLMAETDCHHRHHHSRQEPAEGYLAVMWEELVEAMIHSENRAAVLRYQTLDLGLLHLNCWFSSANSGNDRDRGSYPLEIGSRSRENLALEFRS
jgi:hypothetical protein